MALKNDLVGRQRSGLVSAEHVHRAEVLDGVDPFNDDLLTSHRNRTLGQTHRHDHRQHLWRQPDGYSQCEKEGLHPMALGQAVNEENQRHHHEY